MSKGNPFDSAKDEGEWFTALWDETSAGWEGFGFMFDQNEMAEPEEEPTNESRRSDTEEKYRNSFNKVLDDLQELNTKDTEAAGRMIDVLKEFHPLWRHYNSETDSPGAGNADE